ncbi:hypothetical protein EMIHUDRAFT_447138, partial [Emiliania huxleyi CCMP1516]|uniref:Uncharacterized protein n=2 Tax=Emiliania huxleyi TaxID=2903 RepID=A0A0D3K3W1_EMIH1
PLQVAPAADAARGAAARRRLLGRPRPARASAVGRDVARRRRADRRAGGGAAWGRRRSARRRLSSGQRRRRRIRAACGSLAHVRLVGPARTLRRGDAREGGARRRGGRGCVAAVERNEAAGRRVAAAVLTAALQRVGFPCRRWGGGVLRGGRPEQEKRQGQEVAERERSASFDLSHSAHLLHARQRASAAQARCQRPAPRHAAARRPARP